MPTFDPEITPLLPLLAWVALEIIGLLHVLHALMHVRTSQGTIEWVVSLLTFPYLAIPLYWLVGRTRFTGYVPGRRLPRPLLPGAHQPHPGR